MLVVTAIVAIVRSFPESVLPALNPNQPNQSRNTPSAASVMLWPGMATGLPLEVNLPSLGPTTMAPASAAQPPTLWTTVEPAKSINPSPTLFSQPPPHTQLPYIG